MSAGSRSSRASPVGLSPPPSPPPFPPSRMLATQAIQVNTSGPSAATWNWLKAEYVPIRHIPQSIGILSCQFLWSWSEVVRTFWKMIWILRAVGMCENYRTAFLDRHVHSSGHIHISMSQYYVWEGEAGGSGAGVWWYGNFCRIPWPVIIALLT